MKKGMWNFFALLVVTAALTGCWKKSNTETNLTTSAGFDPLMGQDSLSQIAPSAQSPNQQASIEVLPIETSPVTQSLNQTPAASMENPLSASGSSSSMETLTFNQKIQTALRNAGFYQGSVDGKIGPLSKKAIEAFQRGNGLTADGKVGPKTWEKLEPYLMGASSTGTAAGE